MVNVTGNPKTFAITIDGAEKIGDMAAVDVVAGDIRYNYFYFICFSCIQLAVFDGTRYLVRLYTVFHMAAVDVVAGDSLRNDNILEKEEDVTLKSSTISGITQQFNYTVPQYSVTAERLWKLKFSS